MQRVRECVNERTVKEFFRGGLSHPASYVRRNSGQAQTSQTLVSGRKSGVRGMFSC